MQDFGERPEDRRRVAVLVFEKTYRATLDALVEGLDCRSADIWSFDDAQVRRTAESVLAERGTRVRCRSALKPLVCAFREEVPTVSLERAEIAYPCHPAAPPTRFLLEAYPLIGMLPAVEFQFSPRPEAAEMPAYRLRLTYAGGKERRLTVLAPNAVGASGELSPCGWINCDGTGARLSTTYEAIFHDVMTAIRGMACPGPPCFEELNISVTLPIRDEELGWGDEVLSPREALHEELYFAILEYFQQRFGLTPGDRTLQPGQIVPEIRFGPECSVRVEVRPWDLAVPVLPDQPLSRATRALSSTQIRDELARIPGRAFGVRSVAGRPLEARYKTGTDRAVMISAGQHANEVSGPVGALRAGQELAQLARAHFTLCPLENPDGYALQMRLAQDNPRHMLHAARYTALGDDLEHRQTQPLAEREIRDLAQGMSGALLHVSLHGYPAHEWLRPLTGYLPRGFQDWTLPRGFFLILRHHPDWGGIARRLLEEMTQRLGQQPVLAAFNATQMDMAARHGAKSGEVIGGFACSLIEGQRDSTPLTLITEYPDETLSGAPFIAAHDAQCAAVIAAYDAFQALEITDWRVG